MSTAAVVIVPRAGAVGLVAMRATCIISYRRTARLLIAVCATCGIFSRSRICGNCLHTERLMRLRRSVSW